MRVLINVEIDTQTGNQIIGSGDMGKVMQDIMGALKPEAAYFYPRNGRRAMTLIADLPDAAAIPVALEPFWLRLNAHVETFPCMSADELGEGIARLG